MKNQNKITRLAIIGGEIVTDQRSADEAARFARDWMGSSEADDMVECRVISPDDGGKNLVYECWGRCVATRDDGDLVAEFTSLEKAEDFAAAYNAAALAKMADAEWVNLPRAIDHFHFGGCEQGGYPLSHTATLRVSVDGKEIEFAGYGDARFIGDSDSREAMLAAIGKLIEALRIPTTSHGHQLDEDGMLDDKYTQL